jgi:hypothetical protein
MSRNARFGLGLEEIAHNASTFVAQAFGLPAACSLIPCQLKFTIAVNF